MRAKVAAVVLGLASALVLAGCGGSPTAPGTPEGAQNITLWLIGDTTPSALRNYLVIQYKNINGGRLRIVEQKREDIITTLAEALPNAKNTPDVTEIGNTQSPAFTGVGAFADISDMYEKLGGSKLLSSFVEVGKADGKYYTLPYFFQARYVFYRKDIWEAAGVSAPPATLTDFNRCVITITAKNSEERENFSGFLLTGKDWRTGISWIFANGGDLATQDASGRWTSTLSDANSIKGLYQFQGLFQNSSKAASTAQGDNPWIYLNDTDSFTNTAGEVTNTTLSAGTVMAPGWAHESIGELTKDSTGSMIREWNEGTFGVFPLPGVDGKLAPVFSSGSNIGISARSKNQAGARQLLEIIFSREYQVMLAQNGLGPANSDQMSSLGSDQFAKAMIDSATNSKLTPAAPGWVKIELSGKLEEFFQKVADGGDIPALAKEYDEELTPLLNEK